MKHGGWMAMAMVLALNLNSGAVMAADPGQQPAGASQQGSAAAGDNRARSEPRKETCRVGPHRPPFDQHYFAQCLRRKQAAEAQALRD